MKIKETNIQKQILDYLHLKGYVAFKHRNVGIYKRKTDHYIPLSFGERGISDIIGCTKKGIFFAIEVKRPKGKLTLEQREFLDRVNQKGGIGILADCLEQVIDFL